MENSDQSAFPVTKEILDLAGSGTDPFGLTKREYFAGLAMQGLLERFTIGQLMGNESVLVADCALKLADALLAELSNKQK